MKDTEGWSRRTLLTALGGLPLAAMWGAGCSRPASAQPNVILIMADDASAKEFGCYGSTDHSTPVIDRLAQTGVKFETCWATPICSSSRAEILTGRYGFRTGWYHNFLMPRAKQPGGNLGKSNLTVAEALRAAGYRTAVCGKWQLQGTEEEHGFDEFCIWRNYEGFDGPVETKEAGVLPRRAARYWHPAVVRNGKPVPTTSDDYGPDIFTDFVLDFASRSKDRAFFVNYAMCLPHMSWDFEARREDYLPVPEVNDAGAKTGRQLPGTLKSNVEYIDHIIKRLADGLQEMGVRSRTVLLFTSDNGTAGYGKNSTFMEHGPRVPLIVNCPGLVEPAGSVGSLVDFSDVWPTLLDLTGTAAPDDYVIDGRSFLSSLRGDQAAGRDWIFSFLFDRRFLRDERWLLDGDGNLFDCGDRRDERGYVDVTKSPAPEVRQARERFKGLLADLPAPPPRLVTKAREQYSGHWYFKDFLPPPLEKAAVGLEHQK